MFKAEMSNLHTVYYRSPTVIYRGNVLKDTRSVCYHNPEVLKWCAEYCSGNYYPSPENTPQTFIQFMLESDAILFALRWT